MYRRHNTYTYMECIRLNIRDQHMEEQILFLMSVFHLDFSILTDGNSFASDLDVL